MRLTPSEPDVRTLVGRIKDGEINLQPDFQRGEVWPAKKKQRLVDTILREWHIPPVHLIELPNRKHEVLDGQQRLIAIRDFADDLFPVDGSIEPLSDDINVLGGLRYSELPDVVRRQFNQYAVRVIGITDYVPSEVGELFLRLNQPANLTTAEQRNAFFGHARSQIKDLVSTFGHQLFDPNTIGFSNSRMAYDDVVARFCFTIETDDLWKKIGASDITAKYRSNEGFSSRSLERARKAISLFREVVSSGPDRVRFNKATLFSWILFYDGLLQASGDCQAGVLSPHLHEFEFSRSSLRSHDGFDPGSNLWNQPATRFLLTVFNDRASSRVSDVMSVVLRDFVLSFTLREYFGPELSSPGFLKGTASAFQFVDQHLKVNSRSFSESILEEVLASAKWRALS